VNPRKLLGLEALASHWTVREMGWHIAVEIAAFSMYVHDDNILHY